MPYADSPLSGDGSGTIKVPVVHTRLPPLSSELPTTATTTAIAVADSTKRLASRYYQLKTGHARWTVPALD